MLIYGLNFNLQTFVTKWIIIMKKKIKILSFSFLLANLFINQQVFACAVFPMDIDGTNFKMTAGSFIDNNNSNSPIHFSAPSNKSTLFKIVKDKKSNKFYYVTAKTSAVADPYENSQKATKYVMTVQQLNGDLNGFTFSKNKVSIEETKGSRVARGFEPPQDSTDGKGLSFGNSYKTESCKTDLK